MAVYCGTRYVAARSDVADRYETSRREWVPREKGEYFAHFRVPSTVSLHRDSAERRRGRRGSVDAAHCAKRSWGRTSVPSGQRSEQDRGWTSKTRDAPVAEVDNGSLSEG